MHRKWDESHLLDDPRHDAPDEEVVVRTDGYGLVLGVLLVAGHLGAVTLRAQDTTVTVPALPIPEPLPVLFQKHRPVNDYSGLRSLLRRLAS